MNPATFSTGGGGVSASSSASANSSSGGQFGSMGSFTYNAKNDNVLYAVLGALVIGGVLWLAVK